MDEPQFPEPRERLLSRRSTRRALLAGTATVAAAGTAVAVVGFAQNQSSSAPKHSSTAPSAVSPTPTPDPRAAIDDPKRRAAHLLRRAGFGGTQAQIAEFSTLSREEAADRLLNFETVDNSALDELITSANFNLVTGRQADIIRWWLTRMVYTARPLEERMTLIWHGLLTTQLSKIGLTTTKVMVTQNELFRRNALPRYDDLIKAVSRDPAMLIYLDTWVSTNRHPNENYGRELMELFTLGVGNYTEEDVRASSRAFTGWRVPRPQQVGGKPDLVGYNPQFSIVERDHDNGEKTFLGQTGNFGGDDVIDVIMSQPAAGRFITTRLFTEFANFNPPPETIDRLITVWDSSGHDIKAIVRAILVSDEFYSEASYRAFVRSPVDFMVGAMRGLELAPTAQGIRPIADKTMQGMGQLLFEPPNVAGWPGGSAWLSSGTFFARVNFLDQFFFGADRAITETPPLPALAGADTAEELADKALAIFVDGNVSDGARQSIIDYARNIDDAQDRAATVAYLVLASPEYQLI
ncbi:MAG TPA: DUF1800 domain-containing protein [Tepidiformaceae bacterium]|nr:DUF1800 domain-containing protein [Tepidiformaceae bacterium]